MVRPPRPLGTGADRALTEGTERHGASWALWTYKDIGLQGLVYADPDSSYLKRIAPVLEKKARLGVDAWGSTDAGVREVLDPIEELFLRMAQPYFLKNYRDYPVADLEAKLYVAINAALLTSLHYLMQDAPTIRERDFVASLTDMIVGLLEGPRRPRARRPAARNS